MSIVPLVVKSGNQKQYVVKSRVESHKKWCYRSLSTSGKSWIETLSRIFSRKNIYSTLISHKIENVRTDNIILTCPPDKNQGKELIGTISFWFYFHYLPIYK